MTRAEVDSLIDTLDRHEPTQSGWRAAFDRLKENLATARRIRGLVQLPGSVLFVVLLAASLVTGLEMWANVAIGVGAMLVVWEFAAGRAFPVLEQEGRVAALLKYYGATDVSRKAAY